MLWDKIFNLESCGEKKQAVRTFDTYSNKYGGWQLKLNAYQQKRWLNGKKICCTKFIACEAIQNWDIWDIFVFVLEH